MIIKINNVTKTYDMGRNSVCATDNVNIDIEQGELIAIIGASGSGKTTLLNMIGGLIKPTSGVIQYDNLDIYSLNDTELSEFKVKNIGYVFQQFELLPELTVQENILLPVIIDKKKTSSEDTEHMNRIAKILDISEKLPSYPDEISGGQQQRVAIARALINSPAVLLCDEPTGNLDSKNSNEVIDLLKKINREFSTSVIIVTHNPDIASDCNRIIKLSDGKIVSDTELTR